MQEITGAAQNRRPLPEVFAYLPGLAISLVVAVAATALGLRFSSPVMLFALLLGMSLNYIYVENTRCVKGIDFAGRNLIRLGVALLGLRLTFADINALGIKPLIIVLLAVSLTIGLGILLARLMGFRADFGALTAGATAICGASAALAISAALPKHEDLERDTILTVAGVTVLGTVCMVAYPLAATLLSFDKTETGIFFGGTIHDVAQVVGAAYSVSEETGDVATLTKLLRVACLVPVVILLLLIRKNNRNTGDADGVAVPWFVVGFICLVVVNSLDLLSPAVVTALNDISRWLLVMAISAMGIKTSLGALSKVGSRVIVLLAGETILITLIVTSLLLVL